MALSNSSLASSSYLALSEEEQRKVMEHKREREARSLAVEKAYVHDVYEQISGNISSPCVPVPPLYFLTYRELHRLPVPAMAQSQTVPHRPGAGSVRVRRR